jgi:minor extracellular protease Epr
MKRQLSIFVLLIMTSLQAQSATNITDKALRDIEGKLPDIPVVDKGLKDIEQRLPRIPSEALQQINKDIKQLDNSVKDSLDPLAELDSRIEIKNQLGETLLVEESVENGWRAVEREWVLIASESDITILKEFKFDILGYKELKNIGMSVVRFKTPVGFSKAYLEQELPNRLKAQLGRNHIYEANSEEKPKQPTALKSSRMNKVEKNACTESMKIGMIDTAIDESHSAFADVDIRQKYFLVDDFETPKNHGTAVAGLLIGKGELLPLLPEAELYAASVFYKRNKYSQGATLIHLLQAINWLVEQQVPVINMSLTGPPNPVLEQAIKGASKNNTVIVAAAGNEGPAASPRFPAAYNQVIAVTAVDNEKIVYRWANQGDYIDFSALGVAIKTARSDKSFGAESGTSMASPIVAAHFACQLQKANSQDLAIEQLKKRAVDLGESGKDPVFGYGFIE